MIKQGLLFIFLISAFASMSQEVRDYTDEELTKYASVMVWAEQEKEKMTVAYNESIKDNDVLNAPRFLKIKRANGDSLKLQEIDITKEEQQAFDAIQAGYDSMTTGFMVVYKQKIKTDIGAGLYNALKADLKSRADVKDKYEQLVQTLQKEAVKPD